MERELQAASDGVGPLLQRDYWAVFDECRYTPSQLIAHLRDHFCELPPAELVTFTQRGAMSLGSELDIAIVPAHQACVRVIHEDAQSFTLATVEGHPEAGRITFGAYRNARSDVIFHIRSRARSSSRTGYLGFLAIGDAMQTNTWTDFITNAAAAAEARIRGVINASTEEVEQNPDDDHPLEAPTFRAVGD